MRKREEEKRRGMGRHGQANVGVVRVERSSAGVQAGEPSHVGAYISGLNQL